MSNSQPTIPSRIETTLFAGAREKYGFGTHALRFTHGEREGPGPGQYTAQKSFHEENGEKACWGIRGTGGFASKSRRFGARSLPTLPQPGRGCPGPGAHEPLESLKKIRDHHDFNKCETTGIFHPESGKRLTSLAVPGPGAYETVERKVFDAAKDPPAAVAAFRSKSQRSDFTSGSDLVPGPGAYHDLFAPSSPRKTEFDNYDAVFRQPAKRKVCGVHADLPAASDQARERMGDFAKQVAYECAGYNMMKPGPGQYDHATDMWDGCLVSKEGSSSFQPGSKRTEWAGQDARLIPGPGKYQPESERKLPLPTHQSTFLSNVDRFKLRVDAAPGPSYYDPTRVKGKSFHWNLEKRFC